MMGNSSLDYTGGPNDVITRLLQRGTQEVSESERRCLMMEAEIRLMGFENGGSQKPRNIGYL